MVQVTSQIKEIPGGNLECELKIQLHMSTQLEYDFANKLSERMTAVMAELGKEIGDNIKLESCHKEVKPPSLNIPRRGDTFCSECGLPYIPHSNSDGKCSACSHP